MKNAKSQNSLQYLIVKILITTVNILKDISIHGKPKYAEPDFPNVYLPLG